MDIALLIYRPTESQHQSKDYDVTRGTMEEHWAQGKADAEVTLAASLWLAPMPPDLGARSCDVPGERLYEAAAHVTRSRPAA